MNLWRPLGTLGKSPRDLGITSYPLDSEPPSVHHASTPNTARRSGTGEPISQTELGPWLRRSEEDREPGEASRACSGRTATTLGPRGTSGSATGTWVSRPGGTTRSLRADRRTTRTEPQPGPDHRWSLRRRRATGWIDGGTGLGVPGRSGHSGAVGHRRDTMGHGSLGNRWSSRVRGRSVDGRSGLRIRVRPLGVGPRIV